MSGGAMPGAAVELVDLTGAEKRRRSESRLRRLKRLSVFSGDNPMMDPMTVRHGTSTASVAKDGGAGGEGKAGEDAIFAPTPPLEALRSVLSMATTDFLGRPVHFTRAKV